MRHLASLLRRCWRRLFPRRPAVRPWARLGLVRGFDPVTGTPTGQEYYLVLRPPPQPAIFLELTPRRHWHSSTFTN